jgi:phytoene synthase
VLSQDQEQKKLEGNTAAALVRQRDRERYWSALFAPSAKRSGLHALYAFNAELDHILSTVSEPMAGQIRLQWWRDVIDLAAPGTKTGNPLADALSAAIVEHDLSKDRLIGMVDGRIPVMFGDPPADDHALKDMLLQTDGALFELAAAILGDRSETAQQAAAEAGIAYGLTGRLLKLPFLVARQKLFLPSSYLESRGIDLAEVQRGETTPALGAALADLRGVASRALTHFRSVAPGLDRAAWPAFLHLTLVKPYLRAMAAPGYDPLRTIVSINPMRRFWRIWRSARRHAL